MKSRLLGAVCVSLFGFYFNVSNAALVTINPADYAIGTNLDDVYPGITFSYLSDYNPDHSTVTGDDSITNLIVSTPHGDRTVFSDISGNAFFNSTHVLAINFAMPVNSVSVEFIPDANSTSGTIIAYAANGAGLQGGLNGYLVTDTFPFYGGPLITDYPGPEEPIAMIVTGIEGGGYIGNIKINIVPIPPAVWLFASGLIGLVGVARRRVQS